MEMFLRVFPLFSTFPGCKCAKSVGVSFSDLFAAAIPEAKEKKKRKNPGHRKDARIDPLLRYGKAMVKWRKDERPEFF